MNKLSRYISLISLLGIILIAGSSISPPSDPHYSPLGQDIKIKGLSFVAPSRPFNTDPMVNVKKVNAEWLAVIPYGFTRSDEHTVQHGSKRQWWGERTEGVVETIKKAKEHNLKVMIKPQVWIRGAWVGDFNLHSEEKWKEWEESYAKYILTYAEIAQEYGAEMLCIGTEYKMAMKKRPKFWYDLIDDVRECYDGPLTYSSNWDGYMNVPIWDKLDYIGISAYFPLTSSSTPNQRELMKKWKPTIKKLDQFSKKYKKKIIFTEFGYLSLDGCAGKTWILENERNKHPENPEAQSIAIHCLFEAFWQQDFWAGGFIWKWYPEISERRRDYIKKDYSPQGKLAEQTLADWYNK